MFMSIKCVQTSPMDTCFSLCFPLRQTFYILSCARSGNQDASGDVAVPRIVREIRRGP
jgi:hypothetical protein